MARPARRGPLFRIAAPIAVALVIGALVSSELVVAGAPLHALGSRALTAEPETPTVPTARSALGPAGPNLSWTPLPHPPTFQGTEGGLASVQGEAGAWAFGGGSASGLLGSTYQYNESGDYWTSVGGPVSPTARSNFGFTNLGSTGDLLFGGATNLLLGTVSSETWLLNLTDDEWSQPGTLLSPGARQDMALASGGGQALLYGGWEPNYNGLGSITYGDTWSYNESSNNWSEVEPAAGISPGPLRGASMVFDPLTDEFLLFGGCYPCRSWVWAYSPATSVWKEFTTAGPAPPAGMGASWVWDPALAEAILFGGSNGTVANDVTSLFDPATQTWARLPAGPAPSARAWAAAAYLSPSNNSTLLLVGGVGTAGNYDTDGWRLAEDASVTMAVTDATTGVPLINATVVVPGLTAGATGGNGTVDLANLPATETSFDVTAAGYASSEVGAWLSPGSTQALAVALRPLGVAPVDVYVASESGPPIAHAFVNITEGTYHVGGSPRRTNATGWAVFPSVPTAPAEISASAAGYHPATVELNLTPNGTSTGFVTLAPLLDVHLGVTGILPNGSVVPLLATIRVGGAPFGATNLTGWLNTTTTITGKNNITASAYGFATRSLDASFGFTGTLVEQFQLSAVDFPSVTVSVVQGARGGGVLAVAGALVNLTSNSTVSTGLYNHTFRAPLGVADISPPPGNYTVSAWAVGFAGNRTPAPVDLAAGRPYALTLELAPLPLSTLHVVVLSTAPPEPAVPLANVTLSFLDLNRTTGVATPVVWALVTSSSGWANFSSLPGAEITLDASAAGYYPSSSLLGLSYNRTVDRFAVLLTPEPPTPSSLGSRGPGVRLFPANAVELWPLLLVPGAALVGAARYLTTIRTPGPEPNVATPKSRPRRPEPERPPPGA